MSDISPRRVLHLIIEDFPLNKTVQLAPALSTIDATVEIFSLNETNAREALDKIFAADTVAVWGKVN